MDIETFNSLGESAKFAATMFAYVPYPLNSTSLGTLLKRRCEALPVSVEPVEFAASVIDSLETRKLIQKTDTYGLDYVNRAEYPAKTLVKVLRDAEDKGWLPNMDDLRQALAYAKFGTTECGQFSLQAKCARLVAVGSGAEMSERLAKSLAVSGGLAIARGAVWHAAGLIADEPDFMFTGNGDPLVRVMRYWLNIRFLQGRDVRKALVAQQQRMGQEGGIVMDGRDIGTTVFPKAELKVFVTASAKVRAQRRYDELQAKGMPADFDDILKNVEERDYIDSHRDVSPLRQADDALLLDNSDMTIAEQKQWLLDRFNEAVAN